MFTLFDLIQWTTALGVAIGAAVICHTSWGWMGAIGGGVVGFFAGTIIGRIPIAISLAVFRFQVKRSSTDKLKEDLKEQYYVSHLLIAELVVRGEPVEQFWPYVLSQARSESSDQRRFGWNNLNVWFPRLAQRVDGFDPHASTDTCREKLKPIEEAEPDAAPLPSGGAPSEGR